MTHFRFVAMCALILLSSLGAAGCSTPCLSGYTTYVHGERLASTIVGTPNTWQNEYTVGQQLVASWHLNHAIFQQQPLHIKLTVRFYNHEEDVINIPVERAAGMYIYRILNEDWLCKEGIATYKLELWGNGVLIETWRHQLWVDLISLDPQ